MTPNEKWNADRGDDTLIIDYPLNENSQVIVVWFEDGRCADVASPLTENESSFSSVDIPKFSVLILSLLFFK